MSSLLGCILTKWIFKHLRNGKLYIFITNYYLLIITSNRTPLLKEGNEIRFYQFDEVEVCTFFFRRGLGEVKIKQSWL